MDIEAERAKFYKELISYHYSPENAKLLADNMIGKRDYYSDDLLTSNRAIAYALDLHLLCGRNSGYLDREGRFFSCAYAAHERLCYFLGLDSIELDRQGWIRVSNQWCYSIFKASSKQLAFIESRNYIFNDQKKLPPFRKGK